ncbi:hypothetical protein CRUP_026693 [Coryphaenoides rupestris]|nr:hypothetical protein CRUP_026693 [Coryphaenoides rupestris]
MRWFEGSIPAAIASAKRQSLVFVVVIAGEDEQSTQLQSSWEEDQVSEAAQNCCVAIKVDAKRYGNPVVCVPSSFFIGENGIPLEVVAGSVPAEELLKRITKVQQMHAQQISGSGGAAMPAVPMETSVAPEQVAVAPAAAAAAADPAVCPPDAAGSAPPSKESLSRQEEEDRSHSEAAAPDGDKSSSSDEASHSSQPQENLDVRVERLTKKLEERREQKKKGEEEDRADRAARYAQSQEEVQAAKQAQLQARQAEQEARKEAVARERSAIARIQFRLPDGSLFTNQFSSESRLREARQFAVQEVGNRYGNFSLATMFPLHEFTGEDLDKTLLELELAPSASIVLLPSSRAANSVVQAPGGGVWAILGTILYPLLAVWRFLSGLLFPSPPPPARVAAGGGPGQPGTSGRQQNRETLRKRALEKRPGDFKKDGKIYRLRTQEDSEDDTNTWNGNSTQQM